MRDDSVDQTSPLQVGDVFTICDGVRREVTGTASAPLVSYDRIYRDGKRVKDCCVPRQLDGFRVLSRAAKPAPKPEVKYDWSKLTDGWSVHTILGTQIPGLTKTDHAYRFNVATGDVAAIAYRCAEQSPTAALAFLTEAIDQVAKCVVHETEFDRLKRAVEGAPGPECYSAAPFVGEDTCLMFIAGLRFEVRSGRISASLKEFQTPHQVKRAGALLAYLETKGYVLS